ncbi:hypothetical protein I3842_07G100400 [Carya illinoinensis]|uniref:Uncharacterized protein n=1 Tax=Carya illinoinensis TaxID=32201 RepID=A0A922JDK9_CARIL|nr:hypothetical protein I3842_07G100400 [Carya illinoinensis]
MVIGGGEGSESCESRELFESDEDLNPVPLSFFNLGIEWLSKSFDWVLRKVKEIRNCVGISCDGFEEQFRALRIAIKVGQFALARSTSKKERELKRLECIINYKSRKGVPSKTKARRGLSTVSHESQDHFLECLGTKRL